GILVGDCNGVRVLYLRGLVRNVARRLDGEITAVNQLLKTRSLRIWLLLAGVAALLQAHVGSQDIYLDGKAGPYQLFITVRPPAVIPGVAEIEVRTQSPHVRDLAAAPVPLDAAGAKFAPVPEKLKQS